MIINPAFTPNYSSSQHYGSVVANPDQYLFWDNTHPTRVGHAIIAQVLDDASGRAPSGGFLTRVPLATFAQKPRGGFFTPGLRQSGPQTRLRVCRYLLELLQELLVGRGDPFCHNQVKGFA
jgi:hypothetical protein